MKELEGKKLLVLGGNLISKEIVDKAREMGVYTVVTDWYDTQKSPVKLLADSYWDVSIEDYEELSRRIKEEHIDGVFTGFTDSYLLPYQRLCEMNGLPCYGTKESFEVFTDKEKYKNLCRQYRVPTIDGFEPDSSEIEFPVLVKPADGSGSRGIRICHNKEELDSALSQLNISGKEKKAVIEKYLDGNEVTVFWLFVDGAYYLLAVGNRHIKNNQTGNVIPLPVGYTFPSVVTPTYQRDVEDNAKKMFSSLGVENGMMFMQCKVDNGICRVYDIGYRLTGSLEYKLFKAVYDVDPLEMLIRFALTGRMTKAEPLDNIHPESMKPCFNVSCLCAPGTIKSLEGIEKVKAFPEVIDVVPAHTPGQTISEQMKGWLAQITIRVLGTVDNKAKLYPVMNKIHETLDIISDKGESLLLKGIEESDINGTIL